MQKNIAIVMGGYSSEAEISLKSGDVVYNSLDTNKYALYKVYILKDRWFVLTRIIKNIKLHKNDFSFEKKDNQHVKF